MSATETKMKVTIAEAIREVARAIDGVAVALVTIAQAIQKGKRR